MKCELNHAKLALIYKDKTDKRSYDLILNDVKAKKYFIKLQQECL